MRFSPSGSGAGVNPSSVPSGLRRERRSFAPKPQSIVAIAALFGVTAGLGGFTFVYAKGYSYMTNDPRACANCHVMHEQYDGWIKGSHRAVATCNDCHAPHDLVGKYWTKARNGFWHSFYFTLGGLHEPIRITPGNRAVTEGACRYCHAEVVQAMDGGGPGREAVSCLRCHPGVGHMELGASDGGSFPTAHLRPQPPVGSGGGASEVDR